MVPPALLAALEAADPSWHDALAQGLEAVDRATPGYLQTLAAGHFLPTGNRLFAAFAQPLSAVRHVLVGEGPYPREESATGVCFMDGAVRELWSAKGLSTRVNRATSLRNFMKMLLVCEGQVTVQACSGDALAEVAALALAEDSPYIQSLPDLQQALHRHGFLLLNAALVFRPEVPPVKEGRAWRPFLQVVLDALAQRPELPPPTLVLWGKVAGMLGELEGMERFPKLVAEHPYNLSFIGNPASQAFFKPLQLLRRGTDTCGS